MDISRGAVELAGGFRPFGCVLSAVRLCFENYEASLHQFN
jgi:hypothetical protein